MALFSVKIQELHLSSIFLIIRPHGSGNTLKGELNMSKKMSLKDRVFLCFSNREVMSDDVIYDIPHDEFMDLYITYRVVKYEEGGMQTYLVGNAELKRCDVDLMKLRKTAEENTRMMFKPMLFNLEAAIEQLLNGGKAENLLERTTSEKNESGLYVLTNEFGSYGAVWMLFIEVMKNVYEVIGNNYYILPSSVHELILVSDREGMNPCDLKDMVCTVNKTEVDTIDKMSDSVYFFDSSRYEIRRIA